MKRKITIKMQVYTLLISVSAFCILVVFLSAMTTRDVLVGTRHFFASDEALADFYYNVEEMNVGGRNWLYSGKPEDFQQYEQSAARCRSNLQVIYNNGDPRLTRTFRRLENMIGYYEEAMDQYIAGERTPSDTLSAYQLLNYRCFLIGKTASKFYGYLSDFIETSTQQVHRRWEDTFSGELVILFGFLILGILVNSYTSDQILDPIRTMQENANRIRKGSFDLQPVESAPVELKDLHNAFVEMSRQVQEHIDVLTENSRLEQRILQQERERLAMQNLVIQSELHSLQAQINPHFLFNTLSMISKTAYLSHDDTTSELIDRLASFLRYALDKSSTTSTLMEEIESIQNYFFIQEKRFGSRLKFVTDVGDNVPNLQMPAVVLQPLVENAVKHGMSENQMTITLKVRFKAGRVQILIEDDGVGMPTDQLETLQSCLRLGLDSSRGTPGSGIGVTNVYKRLRMYFGSDLHFNIESEEGCGTLITISAPWEEEK